MTEFYTDEVRSLAAELAQEAIAEHRKSVPLAVAFRGDQGILVAEGDSWFDYPGFNVLDALEWHFDYDVKSVAHSGDTLEEIVYSDKQLVKLVRRLDKLHSKGKRPRAILVSGGGNDIAGCELGVLLNHKRSGLDPVNNAIAEGILHERLGLAWTTYLATVTAIARDIFGGDDIPILNHGYDYPVPDGRGVLGGFWILPGPWLRPAFRRKGYPADKSDLDFEKGVMRDLIDRYGADALRFTLAAMASMDNVHYVEVKGTLSSGSDYKDDWRDELHPTDDGFIEVARLFHEKIQEVS